MSVKTVGALALVASAIFIVSLMLATPAGAQSTACVGVSDECDAATAAAEQVPLLALTGPSTAMILTVFGLLLVTLGTATIVVGGRAEA